MTRQIRVVDHIVAQLVGAGVDFMFGVDGANIEDLYDAAHFSDGITAVLAKHEFSAATMADGYSRAGCGLGVVMATSGGGSLNVIPGLGESFTSRVPVLALIGQAPTTMDGNGSFQDTSGRNGALDAEALFTAVSVYCRRITTAGDIISALPEAISAARRGGPAVLLLPKDIQQSRLPAMPVGEFLPTKSDSDLRPLLQHIRVAKGPVIILAGEQVARDDARDELELVRSLLGASTAVVPDAKDVTGTTGLGAEALLGVTGVLGHPGVAQASRTSGVSVIVGTRLSVTARAGLDEALSRTAVCSLGSAIPFVPCQHIHSDDLRNSLSQLATELGSTGPEPAAPTGEDPRQGELSTPQHNGRGIRYRDAIDALDEALPDRVDIVVDAGNCGAAAIHTLPVRRAGRFIVALGMGGMGYSFGAAIGMTFGRQARHESRRTIALAGDGSFFVHGMEIHTAVQYRLPITFVLFNNNAHAMCVSREQIFYHDLYSYNRFGESSLGAGLAAMFPGLHAVDVDDPRVLREALGQALSTPGPSVVSIRCSADEIPPFAPFLNERDGHHHSTVTTEVQEAIADVPSRS